MKDETNIQHSIQHSKPNIQGEATLRVFQRIFLTRGGELSYCPMTVSAHAITD